MSLQQSKSKKEILTIAIPLFAVSGYSGVSMRSIAKKVGVSAAALYHHFPDKETLYLGAMIQVFTDKSVPLLELLGRDVPAEERLSLVIGHMCELVDQDNDFNMLIQREMMDGDDTRLELLATEVYQELFQGISRLCHELGPGQDPYLFSVSTIGLVLFHFQTKTIRPYLPESTELHSDPKVIAEHITQLVLQGLMTR